MKAPYFVRVDDGGHRPYPVYEGTARAAAFKALVAVERTLYGILGTGTVTTNVRGKVERLEWNEGCPPEGSTFQAAE
jgi:hypothetical protein